MTKLLSKRRVILIGGTSHIGKSTFAKSLANKLDWDYIATDNLAKHPGRPWISANNQIIKKHVAEHYRNLSTPDLLSDVLKHYALKVLPQVETLVQDRKSDLSSKCLIIEGSALYPTLVSNFINKDVQGIWLVGSHSLLKDRIFKNSNFYNVNREKKYLIYKFLKRTLLYNAAMINDLQCLGFTSIYVNSELTSNKLMCKYLELAGSL